MDRDDGRRRRERRFWIAAVVAVLAFIGSASGLSVGLPVVAVITQCPLPLLQQNSAQLGRGAGPGLAPDQQQNAQTIVTEVKKEGLPREAALAALTAALAEDNLHNNAVARDHDSVGLFQQRPSAGWGTVQQIMNPQYATSKFLERLKGLDFLHMSPQQAAQAVQNSGAAYRFQQFVQQAQDLLQQLWAGAQAAPGQVQGRAPAFTCQFGARPNPQGQPQPNDEIPKGLPFPVPPVIPAPGWKQPIPVPSFPPGLPGLRVNPPAITNQCVSGALWGWATAHITDPAFAHPPAFSVDSAYQMTGEAIKNGYKMDVAPKVGDMVVFKNGSFYGAHGHVGLVIGTSGDRYLVAEQNFMNSNPSLLSGWGSWDIRSIGWPDAQASGFIASPPSR
jgi:hypothetical protein